MKPQILVVDDDAVSRKILKLLSERFGYDAHLVQSAKEALEVLEQTRDFAVILMDWQMAEETGIDCTKRIRQLEAQQGGHIPIIGVTAFGMAEHRETCLNAGMDDYLSKPYSLEQFQEKLEQWAGTGRQAS